MQASEVCSCGGRFEAQGRGARAALAEWRQTHQHYTPAPFSPWDIIGPGYVTHPAPKPWEGPWAATTSNAAGEAPMFVEMK